MLAWPVIASRQSSWPLPGIYLIENPMLTLAAASAVPAGSRSGVAIVWTAFGATAAFAVLASLSIGFFYYPGAAALGLAGLLEVSRRRPNARPSLAVGIVVLEG